MNSVAITHKSTRSKRRNKEADMDYKNLTEEQKAKIRECKTPEQMLELAREEGYELSDEQLEAVSGGGAWASGCDDNECPMANCFSLC